MTIATLVTIDVNADPAATFLLMAKTNILSVPVLEEGKFLGFVEMKDLVQAWNVEVQAKRLERKFGRGGVLGPGFVVNVMAGLDLSWGGANTGKVLLTPSVTRPNRLLAAANAHAFVSDTSSAWDAMQLLSTGCHHVAVLNSHREVISLVTQSRLARLLAQNTFRWQEELAIPVSKVCAFPVLAVGMREMAASVLSLMAHCDISSVPILTDDGVWCSTLTLTDLSSLAGKEAAAPLVGASLLNVPILTFLKEVRQGADIDVRYPTISCKPNATLGEAVTKMAACKV